jgi:hypothetical protein
MTAGRTEIVATAQHLMFEPGLYALDFSAPQSVVTDVGLLLPCARLEPVPARPGAGQAFVSIGAGGWLTGNGEAAYVLVSGAAAGLVLTIYKASDRMEAPQIRIRHITSQGMTPAATPPSRVGSEPRVSTPPSVTAPGALPGADAPALGIPLTLLAHIRGAGDVRTDNGWAGRPGSGAPIEGFALMPAGALSAENVEYQAVLGHNWNTPWFRGGEFCGSRGLALPLLGLRVRVTGIAADSYECSVWGRFIGMAPVGPVTGGEACAAGDAALEAFRVVITPRAAASAPAGQAQPSRKPPAKTVGGKQAGKPRAASPAKAKPKPRPQKGQKS